jgi:hypothetical protein
LRIHSGPGLSFCDPTLWAASLATHGMGRTAVLMANARQAFSGPLLGPACQFSPLFLIVALYIKYPTGTEPEMLVVFPESQEEDGCGCWNPAVISPRSGAPAAIPDSLFTPHLRQEGYPAQSIPLVAHHQAPLSCSLCQSQVSSETGCGPWSSHRFRVAIGQLGLEP